MSKRIEERGDAPCAEKKPRRLIAHDRERVDEYYWLRNRDDPRVREYLEAENAYTHRMLESTSTLRDTVFAEMRARIPAEEQSAPYRDGDYLYYHRYEAGREYPVYCRSGTQVDAREEVLLDVNRIAAGADYCSVRNFEVSPDHRLGVFAVDSTGRRFYTLRFIDLATGDLLPDQIADVTDNVEWANDSRTVLYARQDRETLRDYQVFVHRLGESEDQLVYEEEDETYWLQVERSLSGKYLYLSSIATTSTEVRVVSADNPLDEPRLFHPREPGHEYFVTDGVDRFFVLTNSDAVNFRLVSAPLDRTDRMAWTDVVPHRQEVLLDSVEVFESFVALSAVEDGSDQIEILDRESGDLRRLAFPSGACTVSPVDNYRYGAKVLRYGYESLDCPETIYDADVATLESMLVKRQPVPGGFDTANYASERIFVAARDGTRIPVSLLHRKDLRLDGGNPLLLYGYGAYGISTDPDFDSDVFSLIDRGFVFAIAHVRGGSEMGRQWYFDGRQRQKMNSFTDFIDVAEYLIAAGYTSRGRVYASGGSAGGLLMGAVMNLAPGLFNGVLARVPFVDVVTTMLDDSIPLTTGEFDEWGDPNDPGDFEYMLSYSPYDNIAGSEYPHMLVTSGWHDSQVQYWEPAKWVARLRAARTDDHLLLLWTDMDAGHSGKTGRYRSLEDTAREFAFLLWLEECGG